ncbi:MAG: hypothetical protein Q8P42_16430 [Gallionella sp.]|nr:hypothetical protein [Gallionella sp.]
MAKHSVAIQAKAGVVPHWSNMKRNARRLLRPACASARHGGLKTGLPALILDGAWRMSNPKFKPQG